LKNAKEENVSDSDIFYIKHWHWFCDSFGCAFLMCFICVCWQWVGDAVLCKSCEWDGPAALHVTSLCLSVFRCCSSQSQFLPVLPSHIRCQFSISVLWIRSSQSPHYRYECRRELA